jgi:uncharacterized protein
VIHAGGAGDQPGEEAAMPIEFQDQNVDVGGVDDRRGGGGGGGMGGGLAIGGGTGIVGIIIALLFYFFGGAGGGGATGNGLDVTQVGNQQGQVGANSETRDQLKQRCNTAGALDQYTDCRMIKVYNVANNVWNDEFTRRGKDFTTPQLAFFSQQTQTGCGPASAEVGPFYCPADHEIYLELDFLKVLEQKFGINGQFAEAYVLAHEYGHHLQSLLGIEPQVRQAQQANPSQANAYSVAMELQADCFAGVWSNLADKRDTGGIKVVTQDSIKEAQNAAAAVGDDTIQKKMQGRVDREAFTHGSAAQRQQWFTTGYTSGSIDKCNTFNG